MVSCMPADITGFNYCLKGGPKPMIKKAITTKHYERPLLLAPKYMEGGSDFGALNPVCDSSIWFIKSRLSSQSETRRAFNLDTIGMSLGCQRGALPYTGGEEGIFLTMMISRLFTYWPLKFY